MRKILTLFLILTVWMGCDTVEEAELLPVGGVIQLRPQEGMENGPAGRASVRTKAETEPLRYIFEAWTRSAQSRLVARKEVTGTLTEVAPLEISLVPGIYDFLFWADYGAGYYSAGNLRAVKVVESSYTPGKLRDAFAAAKTVVRWETGTSLSVTLKRPLAKLEVCNKDKDFTAGKFVSFAYTNVPMQYDVLTGQTSVLKNLTVGLGHTSASSNLAGDDFLFVPANELLEVKMTVGDVTKSIADLELRVNHITTVTAKFE